MGTIFYVGCYSMGVYVGHLVCTTKARPLPAIKLIAALITIAISANLAVLLPQMARLHRLPLAAEILIGSLIRPLYCLAFATFCWLAFRNGELLFVKMLSSR